MLTCIMTDPTKRRWMRWRWRDSVHAKIKTNECPITAWGVEPVHEPVIADTLTNNTLEVSCGLSGCWDSKTDYALVTFVTILIFKGEIVLQEATLRGIGGHYKFWKTEELYGTEGHQTLDTHTMPVNRMHSLFADRICCISLCFCICIKFLYLHYKIMNE